MPAGFDRGHVLDELTDLSRERVDRALLPSAAARPRNRDIAAGSRPGVTGFGRPKDVRPSCRPSPRGAPPRGQPIDLGRNLSLAQGQHRPAVGFSNPSAGSSRCCLRRDPAKPKLSGKPFSPGLKVRLAWVETPAVMAEGPNGQMDVGMFVVEVLDEDVVVIVPEGFDGKCPRRILDRDRIGARRHRQDDVDRKRPIAAALVVENSIILPALLQILQSDRPVIAAPCSVSASSSPFRVM